MTTGKAVEVSLKALALATLCAIIGYMLFVVTMFMIALIQVAVFIFVILGEGWPGG